jgi:hypothetical protein
MGLLDPITEGLNQALSTGSTGMPFGMDKDSMSMLAMGLNNAAGGGGMMNMLMMMNMLDGNNGSSNSSAPANLAGAPAYIGKDPLTLQTPTGFDPKLQAALPLIMQDLRNQGYQPKIASGIRTPEEQAEKVRLGYSQTQNSKHLYGKAADIVDQRWGWDGPAADPNHPFWNALGEAAKRHGVQWGGDWKNFRDPAHVQVSMLQGIMNQPQSGTPINPIDSYIKNRSLLNSSPTLAQNSNPSLPPLPIAPDGSNIIPHIRAFDKNVPVRDLSPTERDAIIKYLHGSNQAQGNSFLI